MSEMHVHPGDRAYLPSSDMFGDVTRDSILGLKKACVVRSDDGRLTAFCGNVASTVVEKNSAKDGSGNTIDVPTDVKVIGPAVLSKFEINETDQFALFHKFILLDPSVRREKAAFWEAHQYDDQVLATFIPEVLNILQSDDTYVAEHAGRLLAHVTPDIRAIMMANLESRTVADTRKGLIVRFTLIQNDKVQLEEFRQSLFTLLLGDTAYARIEMRRCLFTIRGMTEANADQQLNDFFENATEATIKQFVDEWREKKYYTKAARKAGTRKVLHLLKKATIEKEAPAEM